MSFPHSTFPQHWPRVLAIDWGFNAMCSVGWGAVSPNRRLYVYRHQAFYRKKIEEWAPEVRIFVDQDKPTDIVICHSANQHRGDPHTISGTDDSRIGAGSQINSGWTGN
jgi:hypothetical protein